MKQSKDSSRRGRSSRKGGGRRRGGSGRGRDKTSPSTIARMRAGTSEPEYAESIGDSLDLAIRQAVDILGAREDEVDVEVLEEGRRGFLWFSPKRPFRVRVTWRADQTHEEIVVAGTESLGSAEAPAPSREASDERPRRGSGERLRRDSGERLRRDSGERPSRDSGERPSRGSGSRGDAGERAGGRQRRTEPREIDSTDVPRSPTQPVAEEPEPVGSVTEAERFVSGVLSRMQLDAELTARDEDDGIRLRVSGSSAEAFLAERDGEVQSALQVLTHRVLSRRAERSVPVTIEIGTTGPAHDSDLHATALRLAEQVMATSEAAETAPLSSPDRRIIHRALADHPSVVTESQGRGLLKRVRIAPR